jgi:hypothetical protein
VEVLEEIKWKSADKDNMEFSAKITTWQLDKIKAALATLKERGTVMGAIRDFDTLEIVECRRLEDTKHLTLPPVLVLPMEEIE